MASRVDARVTDPGRHVPNDAPRAAGIPDSAHSSPAGAPRVLVVDDLPTNRRLMRRVLERARFVVSEAATGEAGLAAIRRDGPDVVVLDLHLPGISGFDVARAVRADRDRTIASTPILACSAATEAEVREEALEAGCDGFEGKPFDIRTFPILLEGLIAQRRPG
jgi:CheY-like chemotaxis protein